MNVGAFVVWGVGVTYVRLLLHVGLSRWVHHFSGVEFVRWGSEDTKGCNACGFGPFDNNQYKHFPMACPKSGRLDRLKRLR